MPHKNPIIQYSDGQFQFKVPFIMYADFESILEQIQGPGNNPGISSTRGVNIHTPAGWCVLSKFAYGEVKDIKRDMSSTLELSTRHLSMDWFLKESIEL